MLTHAWRRRELCSAKSVPYAFSLKCMILKKTMSYKFETSVPSWKILYDKGFIWSKNAKMIVKLAEQASLGFGFWSMSWSISSTVDFTISRSFHWMLIYIRAGGRSGHRWNNRGRVFWFYYAGSQFLINTNLFPGYWTRGRICDSPVFIKDVTDCATMK